MPLGDSITSSVPGQRSYRYWLANRLNAAGFSFDFVGSQWGVGGNAPPINFDADHEAYGGIETAGILAGVDGWARASRPQIVILLIGANDLESGQRIAVMRNNVVGILQRLRRVNQYVRILLLKQPPLPGRYQRVSNWNQALSGLAWNYSTLKSPIQVVDTFTGWSIAKHTLDGEHPNAAGEKIIANRVYNALVNTMRDFGQSPR
jgi:lysophospholipase L1-like esterase